MITPEQRDELLAAAHEAVRKAEEVGRLGVIQLVRDTIEAHEENGYEFTIRMVRKALDAAEAFKYEGDGNG